MTPRPPNTSTGLLPGLVALALATAYVIVLLAVEKQTVVLAVLAGGIAAGAGGSPAQPACPGGALV